MMRLARKLGFVHHTLWQRDPTYRWAMLLGPPPLVGCALAALALTVWQHIPRADPTPANTVPWAHWTRPVPHDSQPYTEGSTRPLPKTDATGHFIGFQNGWSGAILPSTVDATMDINVLASVMTTFPVDGSTIALARILDAGPPSGMFVGAVRTFFVIRTKGLYAFSLQLAWSGTQSANCVVRFSSAHHGMIRSVSLNVASQSVVNYAATTFQLEPGLLQLQAVVGCWRGDHAVGPGTMSMLVRRPGEFELTPAAADELIRPL